MKPIDPVTIETNRLVLRSMSPADVDPLLTVFGDPRVMTAFDTQPFNRDQMVEWVERNLQHQAQYGYGLFSMYLKDSGLLIGDCGLEHMRIADEEVVELGFDIRSAYWNRGYATEAATAVCKLAFETLQLPKLCSLIRQSNLPSQRVAQKIGMMRVKEHERYGSLYWSTPSRGKRRFHRPLCAFEQAPVE